ncbi:MAG: 50S ribosomal protein L5 [Pirellulales bacterium]|nr:50S ribosomal protein L5 [Pirellulales bacterium]
MSAKKAKAAEPATKEEIPAPVPRLLEKYEKEILPKLAAQFGRTNRHSLPKLTKIVVNMGVGKAVGEKKYMEEALEVMKQITGQKPLVCLSRKAISNFKLRENLAIGCKVTLRGRRMYEFFDRLVSIVLPRVRDFRGLDPEAFDGRGNYNLGLTEQMVFPEINPDKFTYNQGMNITLVTTAESDVEARELLRFFGMPLRAA